MKHWHVRRSKLSSRRRRANSLNKNKTTLIRLLVAFTGLIVFGQNCAEQNLILGTTQTSSNFEVPVIQVQTGTNAFNFGGEVRLMITNPTTDETYKWFKDGLELFGKTQTTLVISPAQPEDSGRYHAEIAGQFSSNQIEVDIGLPTSCLEIRNALIGQVPASGLYEIDPDGSGPVFPFQVNCDMVTDGGGWTEITAEKAAINFGANLSEVSPANTSGVSATHSPFCQDTGLFHYFYEFNTQFMYTEFFISNYTARSNAGPTNQTDLGNGFVQTDWNVGNGGVNGDISFGSPSDLGPATSFAATGTSGQFAMDAIITFSQPNQPFAINSASNQFRISFSGRPNGATEGWFAWETGSIWVR